MTTTPFRMLSGINRFEISRSLDPGLDETCPQELQKRVENRLVGWKWVMTLDWGLGG